jgi:DNA-binding LacI/PurR family transcriptional regulator
MGGKRTEDRIGFRRLCTVKEIAAASQVGVGTVHRVLKDQSVSSEKMRRVIAAITQLNSIAANAALTGTTDELLKSGTSFAEYS